jgi:uncharacterized protein
MGCTANAVVLLAERLDQYLHGLYRKRRFDIAVGHGFSRFDPPQSSAPMPTYGVPQEQREKGQASTAMEAVMNIEQNKQLVMRGYQFFQDGNIEGLLQLFSDDIEWIGYQSEFVPFSRDYHGRQDVAQFFAELGQAQEAERFEPQEVIAEGDKVVVMGEAEWMVRATGNHYGYPWVHVFTVRDGEIVRFQQYYDTAATEAAFMPADMASTTGAGTGATPPLH